MYIYAWNPKSCLYFRTAATVVRFWLLLRWRNNNPKNWPRASQHFGWKWYCKRPVRVACVGFPTFNISHDSSEYLRSNTLSRNGESININVQPLFEGGVGERALEASGRGIFSKYLCDVLHSHRSTPDPKLFFTLSSIFTEVRRRVYDEAKRLGQLQVPRMDSFLAYHKNRPCSGEFII